MPETVYCNRRAFQIENEDLRVTVLVQGGHVAEIVHKQIGINPLWTPPWPSIEPSTYDPARHPEYGSNSESKLLAGLMGHNLCMDIFGPPSEEEARAGLTVHGEASVVPYEIETSGSMLRARAKLPAAGLAFERTITLDSASPMVHFAETVENLTAADRPIAWTQHVTLGPPFLEPGRTEFELTATRGKTDDFDSGEFDRFVTAAEFEWPKAPARRGGSVDLRIYGSEPKFANFSTQVMDPAREEAHFIAYSPTAKMRFGYAWKRSDFPWCAIWDEYCSRPDAPWNSRTMTRGMEFGASPMAETRRQMIERGKLFETPCFRWIPAKSRVSVEYSAFIEPTRL